MSNIHRLSRLFRGPFHQFLSMLTVNPVTRIQPQATNSLMPTAVRLII